MDESPKPSSSRPIAAAGLDELVRLLKEAAAGMPTEPSPEAGDLRAEITRLDALARRLQSKEIELEARRELVDRNMKAFGEEILPKIRQKLSNSGLEGLFDFHALLVDLNKYLAARLEEAVSPRRSVEAAIEADEKTRLEKEVTRLLSSRRRVLKHPLRRLVQSQEVEIARLKAFVTEAESREAKLSMGLRRLEAELLERQKRDADFEIRIDQLIKIRDGLEDELRRAHQTALDRSEDILRANEASAAIERERRAYEEKVRAALMERERAEIQRDQAHKLLEVRSLETGRSDERAREALRQKTALEGELREAEARYRRLHADTEQLTASLQQREAGLAALAKDVQAAYEGKLHAETEGRRLEQERDRLKARLEAAAKIFDASRAESAALRRELEKSESERAGLVSAIEAARQAPDRLGLVIERLKHEIGARDNRLAERGLELEKLSQEKAGLGDRLALLEKACKEHKAELAALERERAALLGERVSENERKDAQRAALEKELAARGAQSEAEKKRLEEALELPILEAAPADDAARAFETLFPKLSALTAQMRKLAAIPPQQAPPRALAILTARLAQLRDELRASFELLAPPPAAAAVSAAAALDAALKTWELPLKRKGVSILRRVDAKAPKVVGHEERLRLAFHQLLANAFDAMPKGGMLTASVEHDAASGEVRVSVADSGKGYPAEVLKEPFKPFAHPKSGRLGIGLAVAERVVSGLGGRLEVSNPGRGAKATAHLLVYEGTAEPERGELSG